GGEGEGRRGEGGEEGERIGSVNKARRDSREHAGHDGVNRLSQSWDSVELGLPSVALAVRSGAWVTQSLTDPTSTVSNNLTMPFSLVSRLPTFLSRLSSSSSSLRLPFSCLSTSLRSSPQLLLLRARAVRHMYSN